MSFMNAQDIKLSKPSIIQSLLFIFVRRLEDSP